MSRFPGDPWVLLGLPPGSDKAAIKARFRQLALELHPDTCPNPTPESSAKFAQIASATEKLLRGVRSRVAGVGRLRGTGTRADGTGRRPSQTAPAGTREPVSRQPHVPAPQEVQQVHRPGPAHAGTAAHQSAAEAWLIRRCETRGVVRDRFRCRMELSSACTPLLIGMECRRHGRQDVPNGRAPPGDPNA